MPSRVEQVEKQETLTRIEKMKKEFAEMTDEFKDATIRPLLRAFESFEKKVAGDGGSQSNNNGRNTAASNSAPTATEAERVQLLTEARHKPMATGERTVSNNGVSRSNDNATHHASSTQPSNVRAPNVRHDSHQGSQTLEETARSSQPQDAQKKKQQLPVLKAWDHGVFFNELEKHNVHEGNTDAMIYRGTFDGAKRSLAQMFERIEHTFDAIYNVSGHEPTIPWPRSEDKETRLKLWTYQDPNVDDPKGKPYPPHLKCIPLGGETPKVGYPGAIFDTAGFLSTSTLLNPMIPEVIMDFFHDYKKGQNSFDEILESFQSGNGDGFLRRNQVKTIAEKNDWYCDDLFAQQAFTGANPTSICKASKRQVEMFEKAATRQGRNTVAKLLQTQPENFYILDFSDFRSAVGVKPEDDLKCADEFYSKPGEAVPSAMLFTPASVTLFHLDERGHLHPQAIVIDFRSSIEDSVTIFNKRESFTSPKDSEKTDWPWRYAKMCTQTSDWVRHELTAHLCETHLVEEAVIVAANRAFSPDHPVFKLLRPHWTKTLSLNAAARAALVPSIIEKLAGMQGPHVYRFIIQAYKNFNFEKRYVPTDLKARGFDPDDIHPGKGKFRNYGYGYNIHLMWKAIRGFVAGKLASRDIKSDADVENDEEIQAWCTDMRSDTGAQMPSFPVIKTLDQLIDAVTMCVHLASPQHTAVNYLQEYYMTFVINKPPALCAPLPRSEKELNAYEEADLIKALPLNRPRSWLLASHIPHLLSGHVVSHDSLLTFALSYREFAQKSVIRRNHHIEDMRASHDMVEVQRLETLLANDLILRKTAEDFHGALNEMSKLSMQFENGLTFNEGCDPAVKLNMEYKVLQPSETADSIEI